MDCWPISCKVCGTKSEYFDRVLEHLLQSLHQQTNKYYWQEIGTSPARVVTLKNKYFWQEVGTSRAKLVALETEYFWQEVGTSPATCCINKTTKNTFDRKSGHLRSCLWHKKLLFLKGSRGISSRGCGTRNWILLTGSRGISSKSCDTKTHFWQEHCIFVHYIFNLDFSNHIHEKKKHFLLEVVSDDQIGCFLVT